jgi:hypothetical protein
MFGFMLFYFAFCFIAPIILVVLGFSRQVVYLVLVGGAVFTGWQVGECIMLIASS